MFSIRSMYALLSMFFLLSSAGASAGGYTVTYAFDVGDLNDAGKQECNYEEFCLIKSEKLQLSILLSFWDAGHKVVDVNVRGDKGRTGCCFFYDGVDSVKRKIDSLVRLHVFEGRRRRRNEFIENELLGVLYLQFSDMK